MPKSDKSCDICFNASSLASGSLVSVCSTRKTTSRKSLSCEAGQKNVNSALCMALDVWIEVCLWPCNGMLFQPSISPTCLYQRCKDFSPFFTASSLSPLYKYLNCFYIWLCSTFAAFLEVVLSPSPCCMTSSQFYSKAATTELEA